MAECYFCGARLPLDDAIEAGWKPEFYVGNEERGPCCLDCANSRLVEEIDGTFSVRD